jgi:hypothetical protein
LISHHFSVFEKLSIFIQFPVLTNSLYSTRPLLFHHVPIFGKYLYPPVLCIHTDFCITQIPETPPDPCIPSVP